VQQRRNETVQHQISSGWEKPANHGWLKCNVDASFMHKQVGS
jgi:hypothetical protein